MAITAEWTNQLSWGINEGSVTTVIDYDTVVQSVGVSVTPTGDASNVVVTVTIVDESTQQSVVAVNVSQWGLPNNGTRHIVAGPGATGVDLSGKALPTGKVPASLFTRDFQSTSPTWIPVVTVAFPTR